jgi:hypothetical protein
MGTDASVEYNSAINETNSYGFSFLGFSENTFTNNIADGNSYRYGIYGSSYSCAIEHNTVNASTYQGFIFKQIMSILDIMTQQIMKMYSIFLDILITFIQTLQFQILTMVFT